MNYILDLWFFSIFIITLSIIRNRYRRGHLPPGPKGIPILGNIFNLRANPDEPTHITYTHWSKIYGDVFTFNILGSRTIVLNSYKAMDDLIEHRSSNYSDRASQTMLYQLCRWTWNLALMPYSDSWRLHRRTFHQFFQPRMMAEYHDIQRQKTVSLLRKLESSPKDFFQHVRTHAGGIILQVVYGYQIQDYDDPYVMLAGKAIIAAREAGVPGSFLVDNIPALRYLPSWFPGAGFKAKAEVWAGYSDRLRDDPWTLMRHSIDDGTATTPSFCSQSLEKFGIVPPTSNDSVDMEKVIKNCATMAYTAGADTTVSFLLSFILAMTLNPGIQVRAQKELDEVVGSSRVPDISDRNKLPYLNAVYAETLRWIPVLPLGVGHAAVNDDVYEGHLIPGGSTVIINAWAILHDVSLYGPDVENFNPDRFLREHKDLPPHPELIAFGSGRRICPGRYLAIDSIWFAMMYLLVNFNIVKDVDKDGKEIIPAVEYTQGLLSHPLPFKCQFVRRPESPMPTT